MASPDQVRKALGVLRDESRTLEKTQNGRRTESRVENALRIRALNGRCGKCSAVLIEIIEGRRKLVKLRCQNGRSPIDLYRETDIFDEAICEVSPKTPAE